MRGWKDCSGYVSECAWYSGRMLAEGNASSVVRKMLMSRSSFSVDIGKREREWEGENMCGID